MRPIVTSLPDRSTAAWLERLYQLLPHYGHRNWIVVADSAYPSQSNPGIETVATGEEHIPLLTKLLNAIASQQHLRANIYLDAELAHVPEHDASGVSALRDELNQLLGPGALALPHEQIIARLDQSAKLFNVLILKSTLAIPYTSVFLELDCGYWNADAEKRLRESLKQVPDTVPNR